MEITKISDAGFKVKGKKLTVVSNPLGKSMVVSGPDRADFVIPGPGEYEVGGIDILGENGVFRAVVDGLSIVFFGDYEKKLEDDILDKIGSADILLVSANVDGETVAKLEPAVVIPCGSAEAVAKFTKELGHEDLPAIAKYVISKDKLPETTTVVVLS